MKYLLVEWLHDFRDEPSLIYSELDNARFETRKVEIFPDGTIGYASTDETFGRTGLSIESIPSVAEISSDEQFRPREITKEEFESVWRKRYGK